MNEKEAPTVLVEFPAALWAELEDAAHADELSSEEKLSALASLAEELGRAGCRVEALKEDARG